MEKNIIKLIQNEKINRFVCNFEI